MSKEEIEKLLDHYGVLFTEVIADKLLEIIAKERADAIDEFVDRFISKNQLKQMTKKECINAMYVLADELKEQKNEKG